MKSPWRIIEGKPKTAATLSWQRWLGEEFDAVASLCLRKTGRTVKSIPCENGCECSHVVQRDGGAFVGKCRCEKKCADIPLISEDIIVLELDLRSLGRAVAKAFDCDAMDADLRISSTRQVASFGGALPVVLTIQHDRTSFASAVAGLVAKLKEHFILLAPTNQFADANSLGMLKSAKVGFFDLASNLVLVTNGKLQATKSAGELFSPYLPKTSEPESDDEALVYFARLKALESDESKGLKAPLMQVYELYCNKLKTRVEVAKACRCAPSLVSLRLKEIQNKLGRKPLELRALSAQFARIADTLLDSRARHIDRSRAIGGDAPDDND